MNDFFRAVILGIVEGITEFLPISSTGHMILVEPLLGIQEGDPFWTGTFDIFIQVGAILAVMVYFWRRLWVLVFGPRAASPAPEAALEVVKSPAALSSTATATLPAESLSLIARYGDHILVKLFVAFLPAAVVGLAASKFIERHLKTPPVVAGAMILGGIAIILIERARREPRYTDAGTIPMRTAFQIGLFQCLSLIPGTSRSAATIMGALLLGLTHSAAAEFSFFLAIPTMCAAGAYSLLKHVKEIEANQFALLGLGFSVAFVVALLVVAGFMRYIQSHRFTSFAFYRIVLGLIAFGAIAKGWL